MSVQKRTSDATGAVSFRVRFRVNGRDASETFEDPVGAFEFDDLVKQIGGAAAQKVLEQRRARGEASPTLREFTMRYLDPDSGLLTGIEEGTRHGYRRVAELSFLRTLGAQPIDAIDRADVGRWIAWQEKQPSARRAGQLVASKTVSNYHALLSAVFKAGVEAKVCDSNPAYKIRISRGLKRENVFLSPSEFRTVLHFIPDYYKPLVLFLAGTGLRWGEATAITWGDLSLWAKPPTVRVDKAWKKAGYGGPILKHPKSAKARRTVSMSPAIIEALGAPGDGDVLVFKGPLAGKHLWHARFNETVWTPAVTKAMDKELCASLGLTVLGRKPNVHDLRHTHASWLIAAGVPLPYIQSRLGHEKITTTVDVYGHLVPDAHERMAAAMAETLDEEIALPVLSLAETLAELEAMPVLEAELVDDAEVLA